MARWVVKTYTNWEGGFPGTPPPPPPGVIHVNNLMAWDDSPCARVITECMLWVGQVPQKLCPRGFRLGISPPHPVAAWVESTMKHQQ